MVIWDPFVTGTTEAGQLLSFVFAAFCVNRVAVCVVKPALLACTVTPANDIAVGLMIKMLSLVAV